MKKGISYTFLLLCLVFTTLPACKKKEKTSNSESSNPGGSGGTTTGGSTTGGSTGGPVITTTASAYHGLFSISTFSQILQTQTVSATSAAAYFSNSRVVDMSAIGIFAGH